MALECCEERQPNAELNRRYSRLRTSRSMGLKEQLLDNSAETGCHADDHVHLGRSST